MRVWFGHRLAAKVVAVLAAVMVLVAACGGERDSTPSLAKPRADTTVEIEASGSKPSRQIGALLVNWQERGASIVPLAAPSGLEIADGEPLLLGYSPVASTSADGQLLAVFSRGGKVQVFDLSA